MKYKSTLKKTIILSIVLAMTSINVLAQWVAQVSPTTARLQTVQFINSTTGFTSGGFANMYKTIDGGTSWSLVGNYSACDLCFVDANNAFGASYSGTGTMKKTTNGGTSWTTLTPPNSSSIWGTFATSSLTVYYVTTDSKVHKSTNGGTSFTSTTFTGGYTMTDIYFVNPNLGFITDDGGNIRRTTNGGTSWSTVHTDASTEFTAVHFVDANNGYVVGYSGVVKKTTDGGTTWVAKSPDNSSVFYGLRFYDVNNGIVVGYNGTLYRTSNGGTSWVLENSGSIEDLVSVYYTGPNSAVVVGEQGAILKNINLVGIEEFQKEVSIQIYPNPFNSNTNIQIESDLKDVSLTVYDIFGKVVKNAIIENGCYSFERNGLASGVYYIRFESDGKYIRTNKVVIE